MTEPAARKERNLPWGRHLTTREGFVEIEPGKHEWCILKKGNVPKVRHWAEVLEALKNAKVRLGFEPQPVLLKRKAGIIYGGLKSNDVLHSSDGKSTLRLGHLRKQEHSDLVANLAQDVARMHAAGYKARPNDWALTHTEGKASGYALVAFDQIAKYLTADRLGGLLEAYVKEFRDKETQLHFLEKYRRALPDFEHHSEAWRAASDWIDKIKKTQKGEIP